MLLALTVVLLAAGCSQEQPADPDARRFTRTEFPVPEAPGESVISEHGITLDISRVSEGYLMIRYEGSADMAKVQITGPNGIVYTYTLPGSDFQALPLTAGSGSYHLDGLEHAYDEMYAVLLSTDFEVTVSDEFKPFLCPNQYVWFTPESRATALAKELSDRASDDLDYVRQVYHYVTENIVYDKETAALVTAKVIRTYIPDVDRTLADGSGICFDYASLMAAMLRAQGIPTRLVVGYSGTALHAWISVYLKESGWIDKVIRFDGNEWSLMDPTLAAGNDAQSVKKYIGDGSNYTVKFYY